MSRIRKNTIRRKHTIRRKKHKVKSKKQKKIMKGGALTKYTAFIETFKESRMKLKTDASMEITVTIKVKTDIVNASASMRDPEYIDPVFTLSFDGGDDGGDVDITVPSRIFW